jgi:hypothetical protein
MKVRITQGTAASAKLTAVSCVTLAVLVSAAVSACTPSGGSTVPNIPSSAISSALHSVTAKASPTLAHVGTTSPAASHTGTSSPAASHTATSSPTATPHRTVASSTHSATPTRSATARPTHTSSPRIPAGAPATGGGGTAGLQDGFLFGIGGVAILAGVGALGYRRRLTRTR